MNRFRGFLRSATLRFDQGAERLLAWIGRVMTPRARRISFTLMGIVFVFGLIYSVYQSPRLLLEANPVAFAAIALVSFPAVLATTVIRYRLLALASGKHMTLFTAARIVVTGISANMLPLPGGIMVRAAGLTEDGKRFARATRFSLAATFIWLGVASTFSGTFAVLLGLSIVGSVAIGLGLLLVAAGLASFPRDTVYSFLALIVGTNGLLMAFMTLQYWLAFAATGAPIGIAQAAFLTICGPIGVVIAVAPAGIGVTELSAATLSNLIGVDPTQAFVALALSRIAQILVTSALTLTLRHERTT